MSDGFDRRKLKIIYEDYQNTQNNIKSISEVIKKDKIDKIIFITSPYQPKEQKCYGQNKVFDVKIYKSIIGQKTKVF